MPYQSGSEITISASTSAETQEMIMDFRKLQEDCTPLYTLTELNWKKKDILSSLVHILSMPYLGLTYPRPSTPTQWPTGRGSISCAN